MKEFDELIGELCQPFPDEAKKLRHDGRGHYIPISYYIERLNEVAKEQWSHERIGEPTFYHEDRFVYTRVRVTICGRSHDGEGFSKYQVDKQNNQIINRHYAIRSATKDAIRDAITFFGIDGSLTISEKPSDPVSSGHDSTTRSCMKCSKTLSNEEIELLDKQKIKFDYCTDHIPKHLLK